jgi:hypothetical protein
MGRAPNLHALGFRPPDALAACAIVQKQESRVRLIALLSLVAALCGVAVPAAWAQARGAPLVEDDEEDGGNYAIPGISVDAAGRNAFDARRNGWRLAQRKAWPQLWARMTGATPDGAPRLPDSALDAMVAGFDIEQEHIGPTRYIARLGVVFDRGRAGQYLGRSARVIRSSPMLLIPVLRDGGTMLAFERRTPWRAAWSRFRESGSSIDYVRPTGTAGDALLLPPAQAFRPDRNLWRTRFDRYGVADVLVAEARLARRWPGGPIRGAFRALHGPDARELARFTLDAASPAELPAMLDQAVVRMDAAFTAALRDGRLFSQSDLLVELPDIPTGAPVIGSGYAQDFDVAATQSVLVVTLLTPDASALALAEAAVGTTPGVVRVTPAQIGLGASSTLAITHTGPVEELRFRLDQAGWRLDSAGGWTLRRRGTGEPPLPDPSPPAIAQVAEPAAAPFGPGPGEPTPGAPSDVPPPAGDRPATVPAAPPVGPAPSREGQRAPGG